MELGPHSAVCGTLLPCIFSESGFVVAAGASQCHDILALTLLALFLHGVRVCDFFELVYALLALCRWFFLADVIGFSLLVFGLILDPFDLCMEAVWSLAVGSPCSL
ncbi:hypothetical protein Nepgr_028328 [Nepenthes gracilis]|uniref:Uncharacterized protein n=1 Tax=Nepenthes gracilis TaxID=150966 RepID=A0AAD3TBH5_NEPGR|nr:hypothetical protein Nepgr_028328 [Nepenthes gracilis]